MRKTNEILQEKTRGPKLRCFCKYHNLRSISEGHNIVSCDEVEEKMQEARQKLQE